MSVCVYDEAELDRVVSDREPVKDYAIWLRDRVEADEELANKSADDLKKKRINCITLPERLLLGLFLYWKDKQHLDHNNRTLCAGSRGSGGYVPNVFWLALDGRVFVDWLCAGYRFSILRSRQAVS